MLKLEIQHRCGKARTGQLVTPHGSVDTPVFMPVGTAGALKGVTADQARAAGSTMLLANTYHLMLRPGEQVVRDLGGLHKMMAWDGPILTDSGGYQVFSLAHLRTIDDDAVTFQSHIDGASVTLSPERAIDIQIALGADVIMQLDECPPGDAPNAQLSHAVERSAVWAGRCLQKWASYGKPRQALFGIQQGGAHLDLRAESAERLVALDLPGYAIGGLAVGEGHEAMLGVLEHIDGQLPADRPRYLMGVGEPRDILAAVAAGVDMFDCVLPTRNGRNGQAFTWAGPVRLRNAKWTADPRPLSDKCDCYCCSNFSRGTLRHLFMAKEMLGPTLVSIHNLRFFAQFMAAIRQAISAHALAQATSSWLADLYPPAGTDES